MIKDSRATAEKLLALRPNYYDAYLAIGVSKIIYVSLKPAPIRWILQAGGAQTDRERGVEDLRLTAEKGPLPGLPTHGFCWPWLRCAAKICPRRAIC